MFWISFYFLIIFIYIYPKYIFPIYLIFFCVLYQLSFTHLIYICIDSRNLWRVVSSLCWWPITPRTLASRTHMCPSNALSLLASHSSILILRHVYWICVYMNVVCCLCPRAHLRARRIFQAFWSYGMCFCAFWVDVYVFLHIGICLMSLVYVCAIVTFLTRILIGSRVVDRLRRHAVAAGGWWEDCCRAARHWQEGMPHTTHHLKGDSLCTPIKSCFVMRVCAVSFFV